MDSTPYAPTGQSLAEYDFIRLMAEVVKLTEGRKPMTKNEGRTYYTRAEVAAKLGISTRTVDRMRERGELKPYRADRGRGRGGTLIYFDAAQVDQLATQFAPKAS